MKRTLSLLALIAALAPLSPLTAVGTEQHIVQGITFQNPGEWSTATGWYDANKSWSGDGLLCWAATCSNLITWWQVQNGNENVQLSDIWNEYRDTFVNGSGIIGTGLKWWFDGTGTGSEEYELHLKPGVTNPGGHYKENLAGGIVESGKQNIVTLSTTTYGNATNLSKELTSYIDRGYAVGVNFISGQLGHAETIWGVECDETGLITTLYLADSDDVDRGKPDIPAIRTEPVIVKELGGKQVLALEYSQSWSVESVVVLTPTLSNDVKYLNYVDDNSNVILKQKVGAGYTLPEDTESINNIVYDGSRGSVDRQLTVDAAHDGLQAGEIQAAPTSGTNLLEVMEGVTLTARDVTGPGTLVKTGKGTLAIGNSQTTIEVRGGTLASGGTLSDIVVNGGELEAAGTFKNINVQQGTLAVGGEKPGSVTVKGTLTLSNANLEFFVGGWEKKASANDGWDSGTYSWIDMGYGQRFSVKGEDGIKSIVIHVGGDALDALSSTGSFTLDLINEFWSFDFLDSYLAGMKEYTTILVADDAEALAGTGWQAGQDITNLINFGYKFNNGSSWYGSSAIQMVGTFTGVDPPIPPDPVPEPTTGTLSLLALAALAARRRRH